MKLQFARVFLIYMVMTASAHAEGVVAMLSGDSARFLYSTQMWGQQGGPVELETGIMFNEDDNYLFNLGMMLRNDNLDSPLILSLGGRVYAASANEKDPVTNIETTYEIGGLAIGVDVLLIPDNMGGLGFGAHYFYAPDILSNGDAEGVVEFGARLDYQLTPQANIFVGYQSIKADIKERDKDMVIEKGVILGFGIRF